MKNKKLLRILYKSIGFIPYIALAAFMGISTGMFDIDILGTIFGSWVIWYLLCKLIVLIYSRFDVTKDME